MMAPCKDCSNKGCGSYHDKCPAYQDFVAERNKISEDKLKHNACTPYVNKNTARHRNNHVLSIPKK